MRIRPRSLLLAALVATLAGEVAAPAQNLLANPELDGFGTSGFPNDPFPSWNSIGVVPSEGVDADGCVDSSSHRGDANSPITGVTSLTCVPVTPGETLHLEITYRSSALVGVRVTEAFDSGCTSFPIGVVPPPAIPASADWTTVRVQHVVSAGKDGVLFALRADADGAYFVEFDRAYLGRSERVFADDFDGGLCRWSAVVDGFEP